MPNHLFTLLQFMSKRPAAWLDMHKQILEVLYENETDVGVKYTDVWVVNQSVDTHEQYQLRCRAMVLDLRNIHIKAEVMEFNLCFSVTATCTDIVFTPYYIGEPFMAFLSAKVRAVKIDMLLP